MGRNISASLNKYRGWKLMEIVFLQNLTIETTSVWILVKLSKPLNTGGKSGKSHEVLVALVNLESMRGDGTSRGGFSQSATGLGRRRSP